MLWFILKIKKKFFGCAAGMWDLVSLTKDQICSPCIGLALSPNPWTAREVPIF